VRQTPYDTTRYMFTIHRCALGKKKILPIIGGFAGADQHGNITTFGREAQIILQQS